MAENFGTSFQLRPTRTFIVEGDEYDTAFFDKGPKFLHYFPDALILTHVEFDHADIYADLDAVKTAFKRLVISFPAAADPRLRRQRQRHRMRGPAFCPVERYGFSAEADWRIQNLRHENGRNRWEVWRRGRSLGRAGDAPGRRTQRAERHRRRSSRRRKASSKETIHAGALHFQECQAPLEVRAEIAGITVIDDFAHHPTAIRETLRALRSVYPQSRLWAVLEPRSNTLRRKVLEADSLKVCASPTA